jgi:carbamate kinase
MLNYGTDRQTLLRRVSVTEAETYISQGHFRQGSMLPKVEAVTGFVKNGGKRAIITSSLNIESALSGRAGTHFFR